ncbi:MAG TPA: 30S ribosomal protein S5 [Candidatus Limnocylindrales bacterium]|nr:30S ribosomal protein S5 [Candidatus Limnocylindrales bacterium]
MRQRPQNRLNSTPSEFEELIVQINRVSKKTKGGNKVGFSALTVVGDKKGKVGVGLGKAPDVAAAIRKGISQAKKHLVDVPLVNGSIPFRIDIKLGAARIMLKPAPHGSGVIAGGSVRSVVTLAGIENISSKVLGTRNKISNIYATLEALRRVSERGQKQKDRLEAKGKN